MIADSAGQFAAGRAGADPATLEASAARAGLALACCYSTAEEYEAEIIKVRREAGAFDHLTGAAQLRVLLGITAGAAVVALCILMI
jgi:hypothetical protein